MADGGVAEFASALDFASTLEALTGAIERAGLTVFARIDHAAGARQVGLDMPPTVVIFYGHARGGTPIMQAHPQAALDLPLRVLVRQGQDGVVVIAFHPIAELLRAAGVPAELAGRLAPAQQLLIDAFEPRADKNGSIS